MSIYEYLCESCQKVIEAEFPFGKAKKTIKCECGETCERYIGSMNFVLKGGGWPGKSHSLNREMTARNEAAGKRMRKEHDPAPKPVAYDYGNGDIREA